MGESRRLTGRMRHRLEGAGDALARQVLVLQVEEETQDSWTIYDIRRERTLAWRDATVEDFVLGDLIGVRRRVMSMAEMDAMLRRAYKGATLPADGSGLFDGSEA